LRTVNMTSSNFTWRSDFNFALNRNKINSLFGDIGTYTLSGQQYEGEVPDFGNGWFPGQSIDVVWDYDVIGMWQVEEAADAAVYNLRPGDFKVRDLNEDGVLQAINDKVFIGHSQPRFRLGLRNEVDFLRNWSASLFIRADLGHIRAFTPSTAGWSTFDRRSTANYPYWTMDNRSNEFPRLNWSDGAYDGGINLWKDASFVRIQDFSITYRLPAAIAERAMLQNARIFGSIRNLYSFDNWPGWDPESGINNPMPRTYTVGLSLSI
jgi:hypothetical protein